MAGFPNSESFWSASEAWFKSRLAAQKKAIAEGRLAPSRSLSSKAAGWTRMVASPRKDPAVARVKGAMVRTDGGLQASLATLAAAAAPATVRALDDHLPQIAFRHWRDWPVASGLSRSLLALEYDVTSEGYLRGTVSNRAPYLFFIAGHPHRALERDVKAAVPKIGEQIVRLLAQRGR